jgi:hypothetical protein
MQRRKRAPRRLIPALPRFRAENGFSARHMDSACCLQCLWAAVHLAGLIATFLVRAYSGTRAEPLLQAIYLLGLAGVAVATLAGEQFAWNLWLLSGATLGVMIVAVVADFSEHKFEPHG